MNKNPAKHEAGYPPSNLELHKLMERHSLMRKDVAEITGWALSSVDNWLLPPESPNFRRLHQPILEHLKLALPAWLAKRKRAAARKKTA